MNKNEAEKLLNEYRSGKINKKDLAILRNWFHKEDINQIPGDFFENFEMTREEIWVNIQEQKVKNKILNFWSIASAIAVILLLFATVTFICLTKTKTSSLVDRQVIHPGKDLAYLTLSNGKKVLLSGDQVGWVATQSEGVTVMKKSGQLVYTVPHSYAKQGSTPYNTLETPRGGQYQIILPDGSHAWLNSSSSLSYHVSFSSTERKVKLLGEGYFEIIKDRHRPFIVQTEEQEVKVLGTHFNVSAYPDETYTKTTLLEGAVVVSSREKGFTKHIVPGYQAILSKGEITLSKADIEVDVAWKNGFLRFNGQDIYHVMQQLSRWYNIDVKYEGRSSELFYGRISRSKGINEVLKMLELTGRVHFTVSGKEVRVLM